MYVSPPTKINKKLQNSALRALNDRTLRRLRSIHCTRATMRALTTTILFVIITLIYLTAAAPTMSKLQTGQTPTNDAEGKPYIEEVTVESVLQIRSPSKFNRQYRTNTHTSLQDGARVEARQYH